MIVHIEPSQIKGPVTAPPSKSYAHRLLIGGALAQAGSIIHGISGSEDMLATLDCIRALGRSCVTAGNTVTFKETEPLQESGTASYPCRESGSTLRFFIPLALAMTGGGIFTGTERLLSRGIGIYKDMFADKGIAIEEGAGSIRVTGTLPPGHYVMRGDVSSQFATGLLFALPLLADDSTLVVLPPIESRPYIDITISVLSTFGVTVKEEMPGIFQIPGGQTYRTKELTAEGDWSNAAFLYALNALGHSLEIGGLGADSVQGDRICVEYLRRLDEPAPELDLSSCPDLGPVLFAVAAAKHGGRFTGIRRLRIKESDRAEVMAQELRKFGICSDIAENEMTIVPGRLQPPQEMLDGHNDHRIVMSLAVLCSCTGGTIGGAQAVRKSWPDFFKVMEAHGMDIHIIEEKE